MGAQAGVDIDAWVREGGVVIAASERARRALLSAYHRARRADGLTAWKTPAIYDWNSFVRQQWTDRSTDARLLLSSMQERALWSRIIAEQGAAAALLRAPLRRMAEMAMDAHTLLCAYAPRFLNTRTRGDWRQDPGTFSAWLSAFQQACRRDSLITTAQLPLELVAQLQVDTSSRAPLLLAGFDRLLPIQQQLFDTWGHCQTAQMPRQAIDIRSFAAPDGRSEMEACAQWCQAKLSANPDAHLLIITQNAAMRRGEMERALLRKAAQTPELRFEFSLGVPLASVGVLRAALLLLAWLRQPISEADIDWLLSTPYGSADPHEAAQLQAAMRELRRRGLQRMQWSLDAFLQMGVAGRAPIPSAWAERMKRASELLANLSRIDRRPVEWATDVAHLLETAGWPGARGLSSTEYQAVQRFTRVTEECGALGFDGRRMDWGTFSAELEDAMAETLFAPESEDAPILIAGPAESAGLTADGIWFLGAHEEAWPARGALHPLLPAEVQRDFTMPHSSSQADYELAQAITERLLHSAHEVSFSYALQENGVESRASRLLTQVAPTPVLLPLDPTLTNPADSLTVPFSDASRIAFEPGIVRGGTAVLTAQSQCPFKAFATARLDAQAWEAAEPGLTAAQRGKLLHEVLHAIWRGKPEGLSSLDDLRPITEPRNFVAGHVRRVMQTELDAHAREQLPARYLDLEAERLTRLVSQWLEYERERAPFAVERTEFDSVAHIEGLSFKFRLDRVDKLADGSVLVVDYKTGDVSPKSWELPRPDDVQLPLYAAFGLPDGLQVSGLVFAKVRAGQACFSGCVRDVATTLGPVSNLRTLRNSELSPQAMGQWREYIEQLARDFLSGHAAVDPKDSRKTCQRCGLHTICRVHEQGHQNIDEEEADGGNSDAAS